MAKKHKNLDNILIQWDGDLSKPSDGSAQSSPDNIDIVWGGYRPCWADENGHFSQEKASECVIEDMYFEDFDVNEEYKLAIRRGDRPKVVLELSLSDQVSLVLAPPDAGAIGNALLLEVIIV